MKSRTKRITKAAAKAAVVTRAAVDEFIAIVARLNFRRHKEWVGGYCAEIRVVNVPSIVIADIRDDEPDLTVITVEEALQRMEAAKATFKAERGKPFVLSEDPEVINSWSPLTGSKEDDEDFFTYWVEEQELPV